MPAATYNYQKSYNTYTIDQFISCKSDEDICYNNLSFLDSAHYPDIQLEMHYNTYNVVSDYLEELRSEYSVTVVMSDEELEKYMYRPKLLCHDVYGSGELAFLILLINDMCSVKYFKKNKLLMPRKSVMKDISKYLFNTNKNSIFKYNGRTIRNVTY